MTKIVHQGNSDSLDPAEFRIERDDDGDIWIARTMGGKWVYHPEPTGFYIAKEAVRAVIDALSAESGISAGSMSTNKWEEVTVDPRGAGHTYRLRVAGGHIYRTTTLDPDLGSPVDVVVAQSTVFVPDAD